MKKRIMAIIAALAIMTFSTTAFAADSPQAGSTKEDTTVAEGQTVSTDVQAPTESAKSMAETTKVEDADITVKAVAETTVAEAVTAAKNILKDVEALGKLVGDTNLAAAATDSSKSVTATVLSVVNLESTKADKTVTVKNAAIKAGKTYVVLHYTDKGWVTLPATVDADGVLTFKADNFSPFAIVELDVKEKTPAASTPDASKPEASKPDASKPAADQKTDATASPKTGEAIPAALLIMLVCAVGMGVCATKEEI